MQQKILIISLFAAGILAVGASGYAAQGETLQQTASATSESSPIVAVAKRPSSIAALPDFTGIVAQNGPAVVNVSVTGKSEKATSGEDDSQTDPNGGLSQFFRQFKIPAPQNNAPMHGLGSGFIVSPDGIILTNAHVVNGASSVTVKLTDKREFTAKVIGIDKPSDVAVLKIDAGNLPVVKLDSADDVKVGEWVLAIGSPFGFENSATAGIVSAKSRALPDESFVPFIQTDVAVNPGNSGGPLFNIKGEVIGINSQIYSRSGGYQGLSFAIPIDLAMNVKDQLLRHGSVIRGQLGVSIQDVNQSLAESFGLKKPTGALISSVAKGSPAEKAGLKVGDVILSYNEKNVASSIDLPIQVANTAPGSTARLAVMRNGELRNIDLTVGELKNTEIAAADEAGQNRGRLGVIVRPMDRDEQKQGGDAGGVVVKDANGPAAEAGIQRGDLILSLNGTPVKSPEQLKELVAKAGKHIALLVQRDEVKIFVPVDLG
jgi:serine protease Do